jgi:hypothetical protein
MQHAASWCVQKREVGVGTRGLELLALALCLFAMVLIFLFLFKTKPAQRTEDGTWVLLKVETLNAKCHRLIWGVLNNSQSPQQPLAAPEACCTSTSYMYFLPSTLRIAAVTSLPMNS